VKKHVIKNKMKRSGFKKKTLVEVRAKQAVKRHTTPKVKIKSKSKPKVPTVKSLRNKADKMLTPIVKVLHPECLLCGNPTQVAHHHIKKSTSSALRYYIPNLIGLCTPCHCKLHHDEILWTGRVIVLMGMEWLADLEEHKKEEVKTNKQFYQDHIDNLSTYKQI
jgi:5-methylcytosine-specific restriction endonuclease McrA